MIDASFADIAVALKIQADYLAERSEDAEVLAARIGLTPCVAARIIGERRRQAELIGAAHGIFKALSAVEGEAKAMVARVQARAA